MATGEAPTRQHILRFGEFELDLARQTLSRRGIRLKLQNQPCQVLALLIQRAPEVVSRDEIRQRVWGNDVSIDVEHSINFCIRQIRGVLLDNAAAPRFIETLPREGYRFIAALEGIVPQERSDHRSVPPAQEEIPPTRSRAWLIACAAALALAVSVTSWLLSIRKQGASVALHVVPATSYPGRETTPTLSPDGSQIAFSWDGEKGNNLDIYVKLVGENKALRLTSDPRPEFDPVWSPDGRRIAFCRGGESGSEIVLIPALGGPARILANLPKQVDPEHPGRPLTSFWFGENSHPDSELAWFPDGQSLAIVARKYQGGPNAIFLLSVDDGEVQPLTSPPDLSWGDGSPSISPDGRRLAFTRSSVKYPGHAHLYVLPLSARKAPAGESQQVTPKETDLELLGLAWSSDGRRIVFPAARSLWTVALDGRAPTLLALPGYNPSYPAISAKGNQLVFVDSSEDTDIWRVNGPALTHNKSARAPSAPTRLISSTRTDSNPQYSPDGSRIAFTSSRSGADEIWVCDRDGSNLVQLTDQKELQGDAGTPRWSPDGRSLAFRLDQFGVSRCLHGLCPRWAGSSYYVRKFRGRYAELVSRR